MTKYVHSEDLARLRDAMYGVLRHGEAVDCVFRVFHEIKQEYVWLRMQTNVKQQLDGSQRIFALYTEQTELKTAL